MDKITKHLVADFVNIHNVQNTEESEQFERFCNFCVLSREYAETFNIEDVSCGSGGDLGIDGIAIVVNGTLVTTEEEVEDLCKTNNYIEVTFLFVQAKTSNNFDSAQIGQFCYGVRDFFNESSLSPRNDFLQRASKLKDFIFDRSASMTKGNPVCRLYYATTGDWQEDRHLVTKIKSEVKDIEILRLFSDVKFEPLGADEIQNLYRETRSKVRKDFSFSIKSLLPEIPGVEEAYVGVLLATEYLRLITDENGIIIKSLFYDNVRDFQGDNPVNKDIKSTLKTDAKNKFAVLNNGVTIVARSLRTSGNKFFIEDFQIVNGCQTSHVLYNERDSIKDQVYIPIKVIATKDELITNEIIKATNRQTEVKPEDLSALTDFEKKLESYYATYEGKKQLFYERRPKQYNGVQGVPKVNITTRSNQIKNFAAMFLDEPHRSGRYYGTLSKDIGVGKRLFSKDHNPIAYYTSSFAQYKLDFLFRNGSISSDYKPFRFHLLMILRYQVGGSSIPALSATKRIEAYCTKILDVLWSDSKSLKAFNEAALIIEEIGKHDYRERAKTQVVTDDIKKVLREAEAKRSKPT